MPKIKFTATPVLPFDIAHLAYTKGQEVTLSDSGAQRWVRRGVAEYVTEAPSVDTPAVELKAEPKPEVEPEVTTEVVEVPIGEVGESGAVGVDGVYVEPAEEPVATPRRGRPRKAD